MTSMFFVAHGDRPRTVTRLLLALEGRACRVLGCTSLPGGNATVVWVEHNEGRADYVARAVTRVSGVLEVHVVEQVATCDRVVQHRVHTDEAGVVDVTLAVEVDGELRRGAGDGPTLLEATRAALLGTGHAVPWGYAVSPTCGAWLVTDPVTWQPTAVFAAGPGVLAATASTPERAALDVLVATAVVEPAREYASIGA